MPLPKPKTNTARTIEFPPYRTSPAAIDDNKKGPFLFAPESQKLKNEKDTNITVALFKELVYPAFKEKYNIDLNKIGNLLGAGSFGSAWTLEKDQVIKFTNDRSEISNASKIIGKNLPHVIRIDKVFMWPKEISIKDKRGNKTKFNIHGPNSFLGMILQEEITPVDDSFEFSGDYIPDDDIGIDYAELADQFMMGKISIKGMRQFLTDSAKRSGWKIKKGEFFDPFPGFTEGLFALKKNGVYFHDIHEGNIGVRKNGEFVFFDLGFSKSKNVGKATSIQLDHLMKTIINKRKFLKP